MSDDPFGSLDPSSTGGPIEEPRLNFLARLFRRRNKNPAEMPESDMLDFESGPPIGHQAESAPTPTPDADPESDADAESLAAGDGHDPDHAVPDAAGQPRGGDPVDAVDAHPVADPGEGVVEWRLPVRA